MRNGKNPPPGRRRSADSRTGTSPAADSRKAHRLPAADSRTPNRLPAVCLLLCLAVLCVLPGCGYIILDIDETPGSSVARTSGPGTESQGPAVVTSPAETSSAGNYIRDLSYDYSACEAAVNALTYMNLSKYTFMVTVSDAVNDTLYAEDDPDLAPLYAIRNNLVKNRFLAGSFCRSYDDSVLKTGISVSVKAGSDTSSYFSDIVLVPAARAGELAASGLLLDLRILPYYAAMGTGSEGAGSINTKNYVSISEATFDVPGTLLLYYNRDIVGDAARELASAALEGRFTFEYLLEFSKSFPAGSGRSFLTASASPEGAGILGDIAAIRSGFDFTADANGTVPVLASHAAEVTDALTGLITSLAAGAYVPVAAGQDAADAAPADTASAARAGTGPASASAAGSPASTGAAAETSAADPAPGTGAGPEPDSRLGKFLSGESVFLIATADEMRRSLAGAGVRWGVLPLPYAEGTADTARNVSDAGKPVIVAPANNSRYELTGIMLNALAAASGSWIRDGFADVCIGNYLRDNDSYYTLRLALEAPQYMDLADIYGEQVKDYYSATYGAVRGCAADGTPVAQTTDALRTAVNKLLKALK